MRGKWTDGPVAKSLSDRFAMALNKELRRVRHPWAALGINTDRTIGEGISEIHLGMRSRGGVPLNGGEAHDGGHPHAACPYTWGHGPTPYWDLWSIEWQTAAALSLAHPPANHTKTEESDAGQ